MQSPHLYYCGLALVTTQHSRYFICLYHFAFVAVQLNWIRCYAVAPTKHAIMLR